MATKLWEMSCRKPCNLETPSVLPRPCHLKPLEMQGLLTLKPARGCTGQKTAEITIYLKVQGRRAPDTGETRGGSGGV